MKKLMMFASAAVMALSFNSCSSDDNGGGVSEAKLLGKWEFSTQKISAAGQVISNGAYDDNQPGCSKDYVIFSENGVYTEGDYWSSDCDLDEWTDTWSLSGKTITVDGEDATVTSVSSSTLKVKQTYSEGGVNWVYETVFTKAAQ